VARSAENAWQWRRDVVLLSASGTDGGIAPFLPEEGLGVRRVAPFGRALITCLQPGAPIHETIAKRDKQPFMAAEWLFAAGGCLPKLDFVHSGGITDRINQAIQ
jgi:hypothetical protein